MPKLKLIVLKTPQIEILRTFYTRLGFRFVEEQHGKGPLHFSAPLGDGVLEIYPLPDGTDPDVTTRLGFAVTDVEVVVDSLAKADVISAPNQTEWGLRAVLRDPDGRSVEIYESSSTAEVTDA